MQTFGKSDFGKFGLCLKDYLLLLLPPAPPPLPGPAAPRVSSVAIAALPRGWMQVPSSYGGTLFWNWRFKEASNALQPDQQADPACTNDKHAWLRIWQQSGLLHPWRIACNRWLDSDHRLGAMHSKRLQWDEQMPADTVIRPSLDELVEAEQLLRATLGPWSWAIAGIDQTPSQSCPTSLLPPPDAALASWGRPGKRQPAVNAD